MFSANQSTVGEQKDSAYNAEKTGYFVWNMATYALKDAMNASAEELPRDIDEFERAGLTKAEGLVVPVSRGVELPVQFECRYLKTVHFQGNGTMGSADVVFGQVEMIHIDDEALTPDGKRDILKLRPLARMGYYDYTTVDSVFEMKIPGSAKMSVGLPGTAAEND
ncbi:hypothetical protein GCM10011338_09530 [Alteromonas lipolytica]|uniref:Flavin reductase like domain-containing protein n=1 Tax=Alteromonas lipolytica TaxID=1856405 RepID=A0A1E8FC30_9ALTE|nr:hypothetical protein BFC17_04235 [Alteromonas lipolytica]GGF59351.1 hypothetical protein GCM10011338_09530 [Alteromonas lipolytica]